MADKADRSEKYSWTITRRWYEGDYHAGEPVYFLAELWGLSPYMKGHDQVVACFGTFEKRGRHIIYQLYAGDKRHWTEAETYNVNDRESHMLDDICYFLMTGNVEFIWRL